MEVYNVLSVRRYPSFVTDKRTDMTVEEPRAGVISGEADGDVVVATTGVDDVAHNGVVVARLTVNIGKGGKSCSDPLVRAVTGAADNPESVPVQVETI